MKKYLFLTILCFAITTLSFGQLKVIWVHTDNSLTSVNNGDTIVKYGNATNEMIQYLELVNTGAPITAVVVRRDSLDLPTADTDNQFCWGGFCYAPSVSVSTLTESLGQGDTANGAGVFTGEYYPYGHLSPAFIRYTFYDKKNPNSATKGWVVVEYDALPASVQKISNSSIRFDVPYPNPTKNNTSLSFNIEQGQHITMQVYTMMGEVVLTVNEGMLSSGQHTIMLNSSTLNNGVYFVKLTTDSGTAIQRFIIQR